MPVGIGIFIKPAPAIKPQTRSRHRVHDRVYLQQHDFGGRTDEIPQYPASVSLSPPGGTDREMLDITIIFELPIRQKTDERAIRPVTDQTVPVPGERPELLLLGPLLEQRETRGIQLPERSIKPVTRTFDLEMLHILSIRFHFRERPFSVPSCASRRPGQRHGTRNRRIRPANPEQN